jgi:uncharacterized protein (TIGR02300 family)
LGKAALGEKQVCPNCSAKFYDLCKRPATCPKCSNVFDPGDETLRLRRAKTSKTPVYEQDFEDEEENRETEAEEGLEDEAEDTPGLDAESDEPTVMGDEDEDEAVNKEGGLPEGFSEEEEGLEEEEAVADDGAPLLDIDEDEEFDDEDLGEIAEDEGDEGR